jgi:hypothetical protein
MDRLIYGKMHLFINILNLITMKKLILTSILLIVSFCFSFSQNKVGWWKFDDSNDFTKAEVGNSLTLVGTGVHKANGPDASNGAVTVDKKTYFEVDHGIAVKSGASYVNDYSLVIDFKIPAVGTWYNFYQTDPTNTSDGDCFINTSGHIGTYITGYSSLAVSSDKWYRLVISASLNNSYNYYLDGSFIHATDNKQTADGRFSLDKKFLLFADDDGDDGTLDIAEVSLYDGALTDAQVAALGGVGHTSTGISNIQVNNDSNIKIMSPMRDFISITVPDNQKIQNVTLFDTYGHLVLQSMNSDTKINVSGLEKGIYIAKVRIDGKDYYLKCLKD